MSGRERRSSWFPAFARRLSTWAGRPVAFLSAIGLVVAWAVSGPLFDYSENWQLVINTTTTIITFVMVFLIQHTQNRDTEAMQIKLDELIRATDGAHNAILDLEELDEEELMAQHKLYTRLAERARAKLNKGDSDVDCPAIAPQAGVEPEKRVA